MTLRSLIVEVVKSLLFFSSVWSDDMDIETIEVFQTVTFEVLTKKVVHFKQPRYWQKTDVNRKPLIEFF